MHDEELQKHSATLIKLHAAEAEQNDFFDRIIQLEAQVKEKDAALAARDLEAATAASTNAALVEMRQELEDSRHCVADLRLAAQQANAQRHAEAVAARQERRRAEQALAHARGELEEVGGFYLFQEVAG